MTDTTEYRLADGIGRVVRSGLVLEAGETIEASEDRYREHEDVLVPVDGGEDTDSSDTED